MAAPSGRPGFVNAHTHLYSGLVPLGMPAPQPPPATFLEILERIWWRLDRALDELTLRAAARFYIAEALLHRTTALIDHHESPSFIEGSLDVLADACQELGMRAVLCYGATERNGGLEEARRGLAECRRFIETNARPLVRGVVGLHASFTVSDTTIREAGELCRELGTVLHLHVAEDLADVEDARRRGYPGPIERLLALDALPAGSVLAHGVHLTRDQVRMAADAGCWFVQNPRSNRGNHVGYPLALSACPRVALGTDGYPSDMGDELLALVDEAAANGEQGKQVSGRLNLSRVLIAERFGVQADGLKTSDQLDAVVTWGGRMREVTIGGRLIIRNDQLQTADSEEIRREAESAARRLWARMG
ncbi:MAG: amidohydrolase family protein [Acidobacteria bacterium]|nr:amidohydrolase family protein [Acidobacteriota bacterium]